MSGGGAKVATPDYNDLWNSYLTNLVDLGRAQTVQKANTRAKLASSGVTTTSSLWGSLVKEHESEASADRTAIESGTSATLLKSQFDARLDRELHPITLGAPPGAVKTEVKYSDPVKRADTAATLTSLLGREPQEWEISAAIEFGTGKALADSDFVETEVEKADRRASKRAFSAIGTEETSVSPWL